jgi:hypothetical protein
MSFFTTQYTTQSFTSNPYSVSSSGPLISPAPPVYSSNPTGPILVEATTTTFKAADIGPLTTTLIQNTPPQNITFKNTIILGTTDTNNNNAAIDEGYVVSGPTSPGVSPIVIAGGTKAVIPLTTSSAQGAPYLKVHYPINPNGKALYVTYCVANNKMVDGFYDYKTGVPSSFFSALRAWINTNPTNGQQFVNNNSFTVRERVLFFTDYGNLTNKPANSISFQIKFQGTFGPTPPPTDVLTGPSVVSSGPAIISSGPSFVAG